MNKDHSVWQRCTAKGTTLVQTTVTENVIIKKINYDKYINCAKLV